MKRSHVETESSEVPVKARAVAGRLRRYLSKHRLELRRAKSNASLISTPEVSKQQAASRPQAQLVHATVKTCLVFEKETGIQVSQRAQKSRVPLQINGTRTPNRIARGVDSESRRPKVDDRRIAKKELAKVEL